jgi:hypothetical protein
MSTQRSEVGFTLASYAFGDAPLSPSSTLFQSASTVRYGESECQLAPDVALLPSTANVAVALDKDQQHGDAWGSPVVRMQAAHQRSTSGGRTILTLAAVVRGTRFNPITQDATSRLARIGHPLVVVRDEGNEHDCNALAVRVLSGGGCESDGMEMVGHLPAELAAVLSPLIDRDYAVIESCAVRVATPRLRVTVGVSFPASIVPTTAAATADADDVHGHDEGDDIDAAIAQLCEWEAHIDDDDDDDDDRRGTGRGSGHARSHSGGGGGSGNRGRSSCGRAAWSPSRSTSSLPPLDVAATPAPPELNHNDVPHVDASCGLPVLSLFDGIGAAKVALDAGGVRVVNYYSSEVDVDATAVLRKQHGESVVHLGDVRGITAAVMQKIKPDLVIGGSPCQDLSRLNQGHGLGLDGVKSSLFFEFVRVLQLAKNANPSVVFVLENVIPEHEHDRDAMTRMLGVTPLRLLAQLVSPCNRDR